MNLLLKIADYLLPRRCIFCNTPIYGTAACCEKCKDLIPFAEGVCPKCGKSICVCAERNFAFTAVAPVFFYEIGAKNAIKQLKFYERTSYAKSLGKYMYERLLLCDYYSKLELIIPVPMTKKSVHDRGYNQSVMLAKEISKLSGIAADDTTLQKIKETRKQHDLTERERKTNLTGSFTVVAPEKIAGKTILLCDDVYTTGSTFHECARTLLSGGAKEVYCAAVSTTLSRRESEQS